MAEFNMNINSAVCQNMDPLQLSKTSSPQLKNNSQAYSSQFDDVYFNSENPVEDSRYVFISGNNLPSRWPKHDKNSEFVVAEIGFGSGLNFLNTVQSWQQSAKKPLSLHFISCELYPMDKQQINTSLSDFKPLVELKNKLLKLYPLNCYGFHRIHFDKDIKLTLLFGDAAAVYSALVAKVDAWFLDGFNPTKNPKMWSDQLFRQIAKLSKPQTTLATYTAATVIGQKLSAHGFVVHKQKGFGKKRQMITAIFKSNAISSVTKRLWYTLPNKRQTVKSVSILGGGIAGLSLAKAFSHKNIKTTIIDKHPEAMMACSSNPKAMVMPLITAQTSPEALLLLRCFLYAIRAYDKQQFHPIGVLQMALSEQQKTWVHQVFKNLNLPEQIIHKHKNGMLYPGAGFLDTRELKNDWSKYIGSWIHKAAKEINYDGNWHITDSNGEHFHSC
ncbi:MAG: tRNA (5-methylaminomethyl-2-thiouridine)(34)-methyltransferase MnmD, partial [Proteobacteria bacterium]|nr:tRNA (5-methylaminomethyl-2-thiouridine)(34)-methyltransferase MnmD [Pseudomonadota bacterium]